MFSRIERTPAIGGSSASTMTAAANSCQAGSRQDKVPHRADLVLAHVARVAPDHAVIGS
jgi:hypothetical protein